MNILRQNDFPLLLRQIAQVPERLFLKGGALQRDADYVAIVGTRLPSKYGQKMAYEISKCLVECGVTVVSGLAFGVDFWVHKAAVDLGKPTVAFLASGVDKVTPSSHAGFAEEIVACGGSIVSEYERFDSAHKYRFLERNRLISGLCRSTIVIEAKARSGALITARHAFDQDREVYTLLGDIDRVQSRGCLDLIEADMATPITSIGMLLRSLNLKKQPLLQGLSLDLFRLLEQKPLSVNELCEQLGESPAKIATVLTELEMNARIQRSGAIWSKVTIRK